MSEIEIVREHVRLLVALSRADLHDDRADRAVMVAALHELDVVDVAAAALAIIERTASAWVTLGHAEDADDALDAIAQLRPDAA